MPQAPPHGFPARVDFNFITPEEEQYLLEYLLPPLQRLGSEDNHTDGLITHYAEIYRNFNEFPSTTQAALARCRAAAEEVLTARGARLQDRVHILRLDPLGSIQPHFDNMKNSSGCVCGLTLQASRQMLLTHPTDSTLPAYSLDLQPRSFYRLWKEARTTWHHSVEPLTDKSLKSRVSLIFRGVPASTYLLERLKNAKR